MYLGTVIYSRTNQPLYQYYISTGKMLPSKSSKKKKKRTPKSEREGLFHITERVLISLKEAGKRRRGSKTERGKYTF